MITAVYILLTLALMVGATYLIVKLNGDDRSHERPRQIPDRHNRHKGHPTARPAR